MKKPRDVSLLKKKLSATFALKRAREQYAQAQVDYYMVFGNHSASEGRAAPESMQTELTSAPSNTPKIKVSCSQTQFVLLIGKCFQSGILQSPDANVPWVEMCKHFEKKDGRAFNPKDLAKEWSNINPTALGGARKVRGGNEIERILSESGQQGKTSPERIAGSLRESSLSKSAPGRVGSKRGF